MKKQDPRIQRTRQKIINGFMELIKHKEFGAITIADITQQAEINRSTFYYHFVDKYDLIDTIQSEVLTREFFAEVALQEVVNEQTIRLSLEAIRKSRTDLARHCQRAYEEFKPKMDHEVKQRLTETLYTLLDKERGEKEEHQTLATFWSWGIYGVAMDYLEGEETLKSSVQRLTKIILN